MKKLIIIKVILLIALVIFMASCTTEPNIEMRTINPTQGVNERAELLFHYIDYKLVKEQKQITLNYNVNSNVLTIDNVRYEVLNVTNSTIEYKANNEVYFIKFNTGYIWQDNITQTKFDIYKQGQEFKDKDVYVYNN